jgi:CO/xanthine dehydrogenase Mo-binding subunit
VLGAAEFFLEAPVARLKAIQNADGHPTLWWRSVEHTHTTFVVESVIDELAHIDASTGRQIPILMLATGA